MVQSRKPLGSLASAVNVGGEEVLRRRVRPERTAVERQTREMNERGEQTWRPLTRQRVGHFSSCFCGAWCGQRMASVRADHIPRSWKPCWAPWFGGLFLGWTSTAFGRTLNVGGP